MEPRNHGRAVCNEPTSAESAGIVMVEGNQPFPKASVEEGLFRQSPPQGTRPSTGREEYTNREMDGTQSVDAAWTYPQPKDSAQNIREHYAFWRDVAVTELTD
ncbi:DUF427 domain-containing protein [uncultured Arthrobacter sp.]|uniref:DUF427 domain-containing protein n=1 Tax=uncultured Arthrobacter sp. TaxID=114050 RepID=UPI0026001D5A|nr:DUF427 domain-containing protein [uncultured Arthrobacter sp.]